MGYLSNPASGLALDASLGDVLEVYSDTEVTKSNSEAYTKFKEIRLGRGGAYRVKFDLKLLSGTSPAYGRIYRNGAAFGAEQTEAGAGYVTKTEDISGWGVGDLCQLYLKSSAAPSSVRAENFRIYSLDRIDHEVIT